MKFLWPFVMIALVATARGDEEEDWIEAAQKISDTYRAQRTAIMGSQAKSVGIKGEALMKQMCGLKLKQEKLQASFEKECETDGEQYTCSRPKLLQYDRQLKGLKGRLAANLVLLRRVATKAWGLGNDLYNQYANFLQAAQDYLCQDPDDMPKE